MKGIIYILVLGVSIVVLNLIFQTVRMILKDKFSTILFAVTCVYLFGFTLMFVSDVVFSYSVSGTFGILSIIDGFYFILTHNHLAVPIEYNIWSVLAGDLLIVLLSIFILKFCISLLEKAGVSIRKDSETKEYIVKTKEMPVALRVTKDYFGVTFLFMLFSDFTIKQGLLYFWLYAGQLDSFYLKFFLFLLGMTILSFILFLLMMKDLASYLNIQMIFLDNTNYHNVILLFEEVIQFQKTVVTIEKYDKQVQLFMDLNIFEKIDKELFKSDNPIVLISQSNIEWYQSLKKQTL